MVKTIDHLPAVVESETTDEKEIAVMDYSAAANDLLDAAANAKREGRLPEGVSYEDEMDDKGNHSRRLAYSKGGKKLDLKANSTIHEPWSATYSSKKTYSPGGIILDEWSATGKEVASTVRHDGGPTEEKDPSANLIKSRTEDLTEFQSSLEANVTHENNATHEDVPKVRFRRLRKALGRKAAR